MKNNVIEDPRHQPSEVFGINPPAVGAGGPFAFSWVLRYKASLRGGNTILQELRPDQNPGVFTRDYL